MPSFATYMTLFRVSNLPTVWTNVLTAALLSGPVSSWGCLFLPALSLTLFYCGGMALNDLCDEKSDTILQPFRPIPSGRISHKQTLQVIFLIFSSAFVPLMLTPYRTAGVTAGAVLLICIIFYNLFHKRHPLSVLIMASCRTMIYVVTAAALTGRANTEVLIIGFTQYAYVALISMVARYENQRPAGFAVPLIPLMLSGICLIDGIYLAVTLSASWIVIGIAGMMITLFGQRFVRGD